MVFTVLFVCTGNVCRSPGAERLFRARAEGLSETFRLHSAGTDALAGAEIDGSSAAALRHLGVDPRDHHAVQFEAEMGLHADLILTAEVAHRDRVMAEVPSAFRRTFTMLEFARLAVHAGSGLPPEVVARAAAVRGLHVPERPQDDVADCFGADLTTATAVMTQIAHTVRVIVGALSSGQQPLTDRPGPRSRPRPTRATVGRRPRPHLPG